MTKPSGVGDVKTHTFKQGTLNSFSLVPWYLATDR